MHRNAALVLVAGSLMTAACVPYKSNYNCKGYPEHVSCVGMETIYEETHNRDSMWTADLGGGNQVHSHTQGAPANQTDRQSAQQTYTGRKASDVPGSLPYGHTETTYGDYPAQPDPTITPDYTLPIRTPATVMRVWIAPWIDGNDDLMMSGYVYTEIKKRRWMIGEPTVDERTGNFNAYPMVSVQPVDDSSSGAQPASSGPPRQSTRQ